MSAPATLFEFDDDDLDRGFEFDVAEMARAQADADCARGRADLEAKLAKAPEWERVTWANGEEHVSPARAILAGMLDRLPS